MVKAWVLVPGQEEAEDRPEEIKSQVTTWKGVREGPRAGIYFSQAENGTLSSAPFPRIALAPWRPAYLQPCKQGSGKQSQTGKGEQPTSPLSHAGFQPQAGSVGPGKGMRCYNFEF